MVNGNKLIIFFEKNIPNFIEKQRHKINAWLDFLYTLMEQPRIAA